MAKSLVNSVKKALDALDIMVFEDVNREGMPLAELSRRTGVPTNTLHALVATLVDCGYVRQNQRSGYMAGKKIDDVGRLNWIRHELPGKIPELMERYRERTGESVVFYVLVNGEKVPVHTLNRNGVFHIDFNYFRKSPFFSKATSRVIYAFSKEEDQRAIIDRWGMPEENWNDINSLESLREAAEFIREKGREETVSHQKSIYSLALPVLDVKGTLFGAVGTYLPASDSTVKRKKKIGKALRELVAQIEQVIQ